MDLEIVLAQPEGRREGSAPRLFGGMEVEKMSSSTRLSVLTAIGLLLGAAAAAGQGNPTGALSGHVAGQDGLALPGVLVTAASAVLQGARTATTSANGDYIIPFLPSGEYAIK